MSFAMVPVPSDIQLRLRRLEAAPLSFDRLFAADEVPVGLWTDTAFPTEPDERALLGALLRQSGAGGLHVVDLHANQDALAAHLLDPDDDDWDQLEEDFLRWLPATLVVADNGMWSVVWTDEDFAACGARAQMVETVRGTWNEFLNPLDDDAVQRVLGALRDQRGGSYEVQVWGHLIRWAFPEGAKVRSAWDQAPLVQQLSQGESG